ncbi:MAG: hypothetical protein WBA74_27045, partial [Cyclobacteriaceae bacterium]
MKRKETQKAKRSRVAEMKSAQNSAPALSNAFEADSLAGVNSDTAFDSYVKLSEIGFLELIGPKPDNRKGDFDKYLRKKGVYLKKKRKYEELTISFTVQVDSTLSNFSLISGVPDRFPHLVKILSEGPLWIPVLNPAANDVQLKFWVK